MAGEVQVTRMPLSLEHILGENMKQLMIREVIDIPETKPDAAQVIDFVADFRPVETTVLEGKVIVRGILSLKIIYEAVSPYQTVNVVHQDIQIEGFVEVPEAVPGATAEVNVDIEDITFDVTDMGDKIIAQIILVVTARVIETLRVEVVTDVQGPPGLEVRKELLKAESVVAQGKRQVVISQELDVPETKPDVVQVLGQKAELRVTSTRVIAGKVIVAGIINLKTIYEGETPYQTVHAMHHTISFKDFVPIPEAKPNMDARVSLQIEHISYQVPPNGDPIRVSIVLSIKVTLVQTIEVEVVVDVFGIEGIEVTKELIRAEAVIGEDMEQVLATQRVEVPREKPCVVQVVDSVTTPEVKEFQILPGKVRVEGTVHTKIVYEAAVLAQTVHVIETDVPFVAIVEIPGAEPGQRARVSVEVEHAAFDLQAPTTVTVDATQIQAFCTVRVQLVISVFAKVTAPTEIDTLCQYQISVVR